MSESKESESKASETSSSLSLTTAPSEGASVRLEELGETASSGELGETASSEAQVNAPITIITPARSSSGKTPNLLQTILANKGITNITSDHIHVTIDGDDLVIHIKVPKEQSIGAPAAGGSLKKKRSLKSAKKTKTGPLSDK
jgi:hypothetical protein